MKSLISLFLCTSISLAAPAPSPWTSAALISLPMHQCGKVASSQNLICISEGTQNLKSTLSLFEVRPSNKGFEKRTHIELLDTSKSCEGKTLTKAVFYGFEFRDIDGDKVDDVAVLVRAGNAKRKPSEKEPCPQPQIGTAIYELDYLTRPNGFELYEPSDLVVRRFAKLEVLKPQEPQKLN